MKRAILVVILVLGVVFLAGRNVAWADTVEADAPDFVVGQGESSQFFAESQKGSVVPPPGAFTVCSPYDVPGVYSIGGVATLHLDALEPGYCIETVVWNHRFATGRLPGAAADFLSDIVFLRIYYHGELVEKMTAEDGDISLCFAMPPDKNGQIYFYDFFGPRIFNRNRTGPFEWVSNGTFSDDSSIVCTDPMATRAYALAGQ